MRVKICAGVAFIVLFFMLFAAGSVRGQSVYFWWSPTQPVAGQPITFHGDTLGTNYVSIVPIDIAPTGCSSMGHGGGITLGPVYSNITIGPYPNFTPTTEPWNLTLPHGLGAGTYRVELEASGPILAFYAGQSVVPPSNIDPGPRSVCLKLTVSPVTPVPEFNGTLVAFSLSLAVLFCILKGKHWTR